jgi:hypothetical protein
VKRVIAALGAVLMLAGCASSHDAASKPPSHTANGAVAASGGSGAPSVSCRMGLYQNGGTGWDAVVRIDNNTSSPVGTDLVIQAYDSDGQPDGPQTSMSAPLDSDGHPMATIPPGQTVTATTELPLNDPPGTSLTCQVQA